MGDKLYISYPGGPRYMDVLGNIVKVISISYASAIPCCMGLIGLGEDFDLRVYYQGELRRVE